MNDVDAHLFQEGTHYRLYDTLGAHPENGGVRFAVWAPRAERVSVAGDFNSWDGARNPLARGPAGVWQGFVAGAVVCQRYKFRIAGGTEFDKADPFAFRGEPPPGNASVISDLSYEWGDAQWTASWRAGRALDRAMTIYEVHLGSWRRVPEENNRPLTYREAAPLLASYAKEMGFTHVELMPLLEHPYYGSWGYQVTGFFAATSRYGSPQDLMFLVDCLHREGVGVILDWVPSHFATDEHGLARFDGAPLFEPDDDTSVGTWSTYRFDYSRPEVRSFLISSALFWLSRYHFDALRVDALADMLWIDREADRPNRFAVPFVQQANEAVHQHAPEALMIAEESSAWPRVTHPVYAGGLGFDLKWDMGWMHDTLEYLTNDPIARKYVHNLLTFRPMYASTERWVLPLSHDEVKPGFRSLFGKMPGDGWQKYASVRLLLAYMYALPGKKLLFMGDEFAQQREWDADTSLDWHELGDPRHTAVRNLTGLLNWLYKSQPALHENDADAAAGFEWIDCSDVDRSVISFLRKAASTDDPVLAVFNFTPVPRANYRVGAPDGAGWREILNTDAAEYGGSGRGNMGRVEATPIPWHGRRHSLNLLLPPLAGIYLKRV